MGSWTGESLTAGTFSPLLFSEDAKRRAADHALPPGAMRPRSCNALTVFRVADRDRVNFAVFESAQQAYRRPAIRPQADSRSTGPRAPRPLPRSLHYSTS